MLAKGTAKFGRHLAKTSCIKLFLDFSLHSYGVRGCIWRPPVVGVQPRQTKSEFMKANQMKKFSFLKKNSTPITSLQAGDILQSKAEKRRLTIKRSTFVNGILHYEVEVEHGISRSLKLMSGDAMKAFGYRLTETPEQKNRP